ncbi:LytR/AlgR family response regulator transcription factor [Melioribacter sp. OK-6-Me]|uniref:LytR/AlgR family response regulator transcription factor n=1 Tax=unclassified Melioribacter TaxID=2627329 RepID=UPI003ED894C2
MSRIKAIIVDDEEHAREGILLRLKKFNNIYVVAECSDGKEGLNAINKYKPELVFLDIQMPGMSGFEMLNRLKTEEIPVIIFITAYDKYALQAFEVHATDYLLKPINTSRFDAAVKYALELIETNNRREYGVSIKELINEYLNSIGKTQSSYKDYLRRITIKRKNVIKLIDIDDIEYIEAEGDYLNIFTREDEFLERGRLHIIEKKLDPSKFVRIHRSIIVNIEKIDRLVSSEHGDYLVILKSGVKLKMSRNYKEAINKMSASL